MNTQTISLEDAARSLQVSKPTLYRWLESGRIQGVKVGKQWRFRPADLEALMEVRDPASRRRLAAIQSAEASFRDPKTLKEGEFMETLEILQGEEERVACKVLKGILSGAMEREATDVHLEPSDKGVRVRERIGGRLREGPSLPRDSIAPLVRAVQKLSCATTPEGPTRDGRMLFAAAGRTLDVRYNVFPSVHGGAVAMRLLDPKHGYLRRMEQLGLEKDDLERLKALILKPGLVVVTGPTGTGKTTVLYALLQEIAAGGRKAMTVEDPVEVLLDGVVQSQLQEAEGYTFQAAVLGMLRQSAEALMCAEVRDAQTLKLLTQAASTGHLCLTTLHAPDAAKAVGRMLALGVEPFRLAEALSALIAVRVLPRTCPKCRGKGCAPCHRTGTAGTTLVYEMLAPTPELKAAVLAGAAPERIEGMTTLRERGMAKVRAGEVALEDLERAL